MTSERVGREDEQDQQLAKRQRTSAFGRENVATRDEMFEYYSGSAKDKPDEKYMSNFEPCNIVVGGREYPNVEASFQADKMRCSDCPSKASMFECGGEVGDEGKAAKFAGNKKSFKNSRCQLDTAMWERKKDDAMIQALKARLSVDERFREILLHKTRGRYILHYEGRGAGAKSEWGGKWDIEVGKVVGGNKLGEMLMTLRADELRIMKEAESTRTNEEKPSTALH